MRARQEREPRAVVDAATGVRAPSVAPLPARVWVVWLTRRDKPTDLLFVAGTRDSAVRALCAACPQLVRHGDVWVAPRMRAYIQPMAVLP